MPEVEVFTFPEFIPDPVWCDVLYTYQVNSKQGFDMVDKWDESNRTFSFKYTSNFSPFNKDIDLQSVSYLFTILALNGLNNDVESKA